MKYIFSIGMGLITLTCHLFAQCPQPGLKIVTADCGAAKNLVVSSVSCSTLTVKWQGNAGQAYVLSAAYSGDGGINMVTIEGVTSSSDKDGHYSAYIPVREGINVSWNVEATCSTSEIVLHSVKVEGPEAYTSLCEKKPDILKEGNVLVYPNPASNYLMVKFTGKARTALAFKIFDIAGKKMYDKVAEAVTKSGNQYKLDLRNLLPGTYMLELHTNNEISQTKFVLLPK